MRRGADRSDVDFLVEFAGAEDGFTEYFALKEDLEALLSRPVDLVMRGLLRILTSPPQSRRPPKTSMQPEAPALLWEARRAAKLIQDFIARSR